jgi:proteic killer suppression protein
VVKSYADKDIKKLYDEYKCPKWLPKELLERAYAKLYMIDAAKTADDLKTPPSNRYELLKGKRARESSIRINDKWRITFVWNDGNADDIMIEDYH